MRVVHYILDADHQLLSEPDLEKWGRWHADIERRRVGRDDVGFITVSTIFFGLKIQWDKRLPDFFETRMQANNEEWSRELTWATWQDAEMGHQMLVAAAQRWFARHGQAGGALPDLVGDAKRDAFWQDAGS